MSNLRFQSAYRQLTAADRPFVDGFVARVERMSEIQRRMPVDVLESLRDDDFTDRERENLARPLVAAAVYERCQALGELQNLSTRRLMKELAGIALFNISDYMTPGGSIDATVATTEQLAAIKEIKVTESVRAGETKYEIKGFDKIAAIRMILQLQGKLDGDRLATPVESEFISGDIPADVTSDKLSEGYQNLLEGLKDA